MRDDEFRRRAHALIEQLRRASGPHGCHCEAAIGNPMARCGERCAEAKALLAAGPERVWPWRFEMSAEVEVVGGRREGFRGRVVERSIYCDGMYVEIESASGERYFTHADNENLKGVPPVEPPNVTSAEK